MPSIIPKITINGKESTEISGLIIVSLPPIIKPAMRAVAEEIDGRDGDQIEKLGFSAYDKTIRIALSGNYDVDDVIEYFNQDGIITFSNEPDKYYRFKQLEGIDFEKLMRYKTADVVFHCQPFKFSTTDEELTFFEPHSVSITNAGNIYSKPEIALTGHGNMEMGINGSPVLAVDFGDEQQTIIIDSEKMNAYGAQSNIKSLITEINPKQDLHGYDSAWMEKGNNSPYLFRKIAGTASRFGNAVIDQIVGGSVAWNQLLPVSSRSSTTVADVAITNNNDGTYTFNGLYNNQAFNYWLIGNYAQTTEVFRFLANHVYYVLGVYLFYNTSVVYAGNFSIPRFAKFDNDVIVSSIRPRDPDNNTNFNNYKYAPMIIDLTQMLGSTIADYIYSLEQATAGAGVSYFKALFPNDYYPYNAGELLSVKALAHNTIGFNQWDGLTESGYIYNGKLYSSNSYWRTANYIPVVSGEAYYFKTASTDGQINFFDAEKNFISAVDSMGGSARLATAPSNAKYVKFYQPNATDKNSVCVNISNPSLNGTYEQYHENVYPMDSSLELRGIPQIDANGKLTYYGDTYSSDGNVNRKMGFISDLSSLSWLMGNRNNSDTGYIFYMPSLDMKEYSECITSKLFTNRAGEIGLWESLELNEISVVRDYLILCSDKTNVEDLKAQISSISLAYFKKVATSETAQPFTNPQNVDANGSEEYIDGNVYGIVDIGSLEWTYSSRNDANTGSVFYTIPSDAKSNSIIISDDFTNIDYPSWTDIDVNTGGFRNNYLILCADYTDAATFKTAMSGKYLIYEKASSPSVELPVGHNTLYANICEINGWNSCDVSRTGVNLWDETWENCYWDEGRSGIKVENAQSFGCADYIFIKGAESLYFKAPNSQTPYTYYVLFYDENKNMISFVRPIGETVLSIPENAVYCTFYNYLGYGTSYNHDISFNMPETETDYFAYEGITKNIPFNQTVFGGSLNVKTGLLTISKVKISGIVQSIAPYSYNNIVYGRILKPENSKNRGNTGIHGLITSMFYVDGASGNWDDASKIGKILTGADYDFYWIGFPIGSTLDDMQNITANNEICYELASPILIQLTAEEIMALIGENHIFTNTGAIESCVYMKDGAEIETSGEIITFIADVGDIISNAFKNRLVIGNYDDVKLEKGINTITFNPIEEGSEIDEMAISKYSRWL